MCRVLARILACVLPVYCPCQVKRSEILAAAYDFFEVHAKKRVSIRYSNDTPVYVPMVSTHAFCLQTEITALFLAGRVEFIGEEGIGLGPTLEFFTIVAHQLQKKVDFNHFSQLKLAW